MTSFVITDREREAMRLGGCSYLARLIYYEALRPYMDFMTRLVGITHGISYQSIAEALYVEPVRGRHSDDSGTPTRKAIRSALEALEKAGLLERRAHPSRPEAIVFFLKMAHEGKDRPNDEGHMRGRPAYTMRGIHLGSDKEAKEEGLNISPPTPPEGVMPGGDVMGDPPVMETGRKPRSRTKAKPEPLTLPDWLDPQTWQDFEEHRKALKKPLVNSTPRYLIRDLEKLRAQGHDPNAVLAQSISRGWVGVFPIHHDDTSPPKRSPPRQEDIDYHAGVNPDGSF